MVTPASASAWTAAAVAAAFFWVAVHVYCRPFVWSVGRPEGRNVLLRHGHRLVRPVSRPVELKDPAFRVRFRLLRGSPYFACGVILGGRDRVPLPSGVEVLRELCQLCTVPCLAHEVRTGLHDRAAVVDLSRANALRGEQCDKVLRQDQKTMATVDR